MEKLPNKVLENAIRIHNATIKAFENFKDADYCSSLDKVIVQLLEELKEYRSLEEQGLLVKLPCKACDVLYSFVNGKTIELEVLSIKYQIEAENHGIFIRERIIIDADGIETEINFSDIGKIVFLTQEEAEQALKRLESE